MGDPKKFYAKIYMWWFIIFFFVIFLKVFGKNDIIIAMYFAAIVIFNVDLTAKLNSSFLSYLEKTYGTWDNIASLLKKTYATNYVPSARNPYRFVWLVFSKYDFDDDNIKNFKLAIKLYPSFGIIVIPSILPTAYFFMSTPSIYTVLGK